MKLHCIVYPRSISNGILLKLNTFQRSTYMYILAQGTLETKLGFQSFYKDEKFSVWEDAENIKRCVLNIFMGVYNCYALGSWLVLIFLTLPPTAYLIRWLLKTPPPQISWKELFWTLYCYRPFVNRYT